MRSWQKDRNYRYYENEDGTIRYTITVDGETVAVTEEVYQAYAQMDRRERYTYEREDGLVQSLDKLAEEGMASSALTERHIKSAEDTALHNMSISGLVKALAILSVEEQKLVDMLLIRRVPIRELARRYGVRLYTMQYRRDRILDKLREIMSEK